MTCYQYYHKYVKINVIKHIDIPIYHFHIHGSSIQMHLQTTLASAGCVVNPKSALLSNLPSFSSVAKSNARFGGLATHEAKHMGRKI